MARHMKQDVSPEDEEPSEEIAAPETDDEEASVTQGGAYSAGDEGTTIQEGFTPIVGHDRHADARDRKHKGKASAYGELDPYGLDEKKKKKHPVLRVLSTLLLIAGVVLIGIAGYMWFHAQQQYQQQEQVNEELAQYATEPEDNANGAPIIDWAGLEAINPDVVGWIYIPDTVVNYPVYQGANNDEYLRHTATGEYSLGGQVFMDYQNTEPGMRDAQTIIYGHHLLDGSMFKPVADMADQAAFDSHPTVWYVDENNQSYELEPLLVYKTTADDTNVRTLSFMTGDDFHSYLTELFGKSVASRADASAIIAQTSHVLTLVTCNYDNGTGRTVLICVPKSEAAAADAAA